MVLLNAVEALMITESYDVAEGRCDLEKLVSLRKTFSFAPAGVVCVARSYIQPMQIKVLRLLKNGKWCAIKKGTENSIISRKSPLYSNRLTNGGDLNLDSRQIGLNN